MNHHWLLSIHPFGLTLPPAVNIRISKFICPTYYTMCQLMSVPWESSTGQKENTLSRTSLFSTETPIAWREKYTLTCLVSNILKKVWMTDIFHVDFSQEWWANLSLFCWLWVFTTFPSLINSPWNCFSSSHPRRHPPGSLCPSWPWRKSGVVVSDTDAAPLHEGCRWSWGTVPETLEWC